MTIEDVKDWVGLNPTHPKVKDIEFELNLIKRYQDSMHNELTIPQFKKYMQKQNALVSAVIGFKAISWAQTIHHPLPSINVENDEYISMLIDFMKYEYLEARKNPEKMMEMIEQMMGAEMYNEKWQCVHDQNLETQIKHALEYIAMIIAKDTNPISQSGTL